MEGYFLLLGNGDELVGLKRVNQVRGFSRFLTPLGRNFFKREKQIKWAALKDEKWSKNRESMVYSAGETNDIVPLSHFR